MEKDKLEQIAKFMSRTSGELHAMSDVLAAVLVVLPDRQILLRALDQICSETYDYQQLAGFDWPDEYHKARGQVFERLRARLQS